VRLPFWKPRTLFVMSVVNLIARCGVSTIRRPFSPPF
jgi:hypothetical protein